MTIGQHHSVDKADLNRTLKIIYSLDGPNIEGSFTNFFRNPNNEGKAPGEYFWPPMLGDVYVSHPLRSPQIFEEDLDRQTLNDNVVRVEGTFIRWCRLEATTIANPMLKVLAGQKVDLLILTSTETGELPRSAAYGGVDLRKFTQSAKTIADSKELLSIIQDFAND